MKGRKGKKNVKRIEKIMVNRFSNLMEVINLHIQGAQQTPRTRSITKLTNYYTNQTYHNQITQNHC